MTREVMLSCMTLFCECFECPCWGCNTDEAGCVRGDTAQWHYRRRGIHISQDITTIAPVIIEKKTCLLMLLNLKTGGG